MKGAENSCAFPVISIDGLENIFCTDPCEMVDQDYGTLARTFSVLFIQLPNLLARFVLKELRCVFHPSRTNACEPLHALSHWIKTNYGYAIKPTNVVLSEAFSNVVTSEIFQSEYAKIVAHLSLWEREWLEQAQQILKNFLI